MFFLNWLFVIRLSQVQTATDLLVWKLIHHFSMDNNGVYTISPLGDEWFMHLFPRAVHTDNQSLLFFRGRSYSPQDSLFSKILKCDQIVDKFKYTPKKKIVCWQFWSRVADYLMSLNGNKFPVSFIFPLNVHLWTPVCLGAASHQ